jgi:hypothetical protein
LYLAKGHKKAGLATGFSFFSPELIGGSSVSSRSGSVSSRSGSVSSRHGSVSGGSSFRSGSRSSSFRSGSRSFSSFFFFAASGQSNGQHGGQQNGVFHLLPLTKIVDIQKSVENLEIQPTPKF